MSTLARVVFRTLTAYGKYTRPVNVGAHAEHLYDAARKKRNIYIFVKCDALLFLRSPFSNYFLGIVVA